MEFAQLAKVLVGATSQLLEFVSEQMPDGWSVTLHEQPGEGGRPLYLVRENGERRDIADSPERAIRQAEREVSRREELEMRGNV